MNITTENLEKFVVDCQPKLDAIKTSLSAFNIFNVLGIQHREIRHSNFLGWLFDPNESHKLNDIFLKALFKLLRQRGVLEPEQYTNLLLADLTETNVYRESVNNIDILIINKTLGFVICIENKIYAGFAEHQLKKYHDFIVKNYEDLPNKIFLTLTPNHSNQHFKFRGGEYYTNINYRQITSLIENNKDIINSAFPTVKESINQYVAMVKKDITQTSDEIKLARKIYGKYKKVIDFIISNQQDLSLYRNQILNHITTVGLEGFKISHDSGNENVIYLLPDNKELLNLFYYPEAKSRDGDYIFSLVIYFEVHAVWMKFGFGDIKSPEKHMEIQTKKEKLFDEMKLFECFKETKLKVDFHNKKTSDKYPSICGAPIFNIDDYYSEDKPALELFKLKFEELNNELIKPWVIECKEKLSVII
ncbi:PD-(D/E)XK nuclease family protein [Maribacter sp. MAR_2009_72]|uniref:PDDEXK-like family protein n=1 Tax=Maribacter sp. MAR_2009_72 TaxID=1250050 RepID=UPI00119AC8AA|nr:PD-(D/E)XK nuclease family protein [Maribacter sp. MAR_2009_72]TVZ13953.1 PD-(D/E)XK nuclease superfamily protein [Maribacter sp. MAR_2009_72]